MIPKVWKCGSPSSIKLVIVRMGSANINNPIVRILLEISQDMEKQLP
jgi:hypothetical protein